MRLPGWQVSGMARPAQRHLRWFFGLGAVGLALTAAANILVNPWRVLPKATEIEALDPYREIDAEIRTCKAGLALHGDWDTLIIGSSRPSSGIDPEGPAFRSLKAVNLGMNGGDLFETRAMLDHALRSRSPKTAVLFIDAGDLTRPGKIQIESDFEFSPLSKSDPLERSMRYLFSQRSFDAAVVALSAAAKQKPTHYTRFGMQRKQPPHLNYFDTMEKYYLPWAELLTAAQKRNLGIQQDKIAVIREMLETCARRDVRALLAIPPNHLTLTQAMEEGGAPDPWFLAERRALAGLVAAVNATRSGPPCEFWDFNIPSPATTEPFPPRDQPRAMLNWLDPIHFTPVAGDRYAALLLGTRDEDGALGHHVDPADPDAYVARVEQLFQDARSQLPEERTGIRKALEK